MGDAVGGGAGGGTAAPGAGGNTGAGAAGAGPSGAPAGNVPAVSSDWTSGLNNEMRGYVQNKGFKDPGMVLDSYVNLEKLMGGDKNTLLRIPQKADAPEWADVYTKLGRPASAHEYGINPVDDSPMAKSTTDWAKNTFHELGLSRRQGETLVAKWTDLNQKVMAEQKASYAATIEAEDKALRKEWGMAYDQNIQIAKKGMVMFGISPQMIDNLERAMGFSATLKFMQNLGSKVGEDKFFSGVQAPGALTPEAARDRISALRKDNDFVRRYAAGDASAKEEMTNLHKFAYPEVQ